MVNAKPSPFICPHCRQPLSVQSGSLRCLQRHSFDIAREGYVNLLLGKRPKFPGDSKAMLLARRRFLRAGHYQELLNTMAAITADLPAVATVLDAGCGEGHYLANLAAGWGDGVTLVGIDLAKDASKLAAKAAPTLHVAVADVNRLLPVADGCVDLLLNVFAPRSSAEFARVVGANGRLLTVIPASDHLASLRQQFGLLSIAADKTTVIEAQMAPSFALTAIHECRFSLPLPNTAVQDLIAMTPSARHLNAADWETIASSGSHTTTAAFELLLFQRQA